MLSGDSSGTKLSRFLQWLLYSTLHTHYDYLQTSMHPFRAEIDGWRRIQAVFPYRVSLYIRKSSLITVLRDGVFVVCIFMYWFRAHWVWLGRRLVVRATETDKDKGTVDFAFFVFVFCESFGWYWDFEWSELVAYGFRFELLFVMFGWCVVVGAKVPDKAPADKGSSINQILGIKGAKQETVSLFCCLIYGFTECDLRRIGFPV